MQVRIALHYDAGDQPGGIPLAEMVGRVRAAEAAGFDVVWVGESALDRPGGLPAALLLCGALAAATERIRIGSAVLPLPLHHPIRVAEDAATVASIAPGRFELGVGLGANPEGLHGFGVAVPERVARFEEAVELIRLAWRDGPIRFHGRYFSLDDVDVVPKPASPPPLWVGASSDEGQRRAARLGAGLWSRTAEVPQAYFAEWEAQRRPPADARVALLQRSPAVAACREALDRLAGRAGQVDLVLPALAHPPETLEAALRALRGRMPL